MKITLTLWSRKDKEGYPVKVRISDGNKKTYVNTGVHIEKRFWNSNSQNIRLSHPQSSELNEKLDKKLNEVKQHFGQYSKGDVLNYTEKYIQHLFNIKKFGTYKKIRVVKKLLEDYIKTELNKNDITWKEMDSDFIKNWIEYVYKNRDIQEITMKGYLKKIKEIWNKAREENIHYNLPYPFTSIKIKDREIQHKGLSIYDLNKLLKRLNENKDDYSLESEVLDIFIFQLYTGGMRISDALKLKWINVDSHSITYKMSKTGKEMTIPITAMSYQILKKYFPVKDKKPFKKLLSENIKSIGDMYIFNFLDEDINENTIQFYNMTSSKTALINKYLKKVSDELSIRNLSTHIQRHTITSIMVSKGVNLQFVKEMLGHSSLKTTETYINSLKDSFREDFKRNMNTIKENKSKRVNFIEDNFSI